jgi:dihydroorotate dehydrogenase
MIRPTLLRLYERAYTTRLRPLLFRYSAQEAHTIMMRLLEIADNTPPLLDLLGALQWALHEKQPLVVGGVHLSAPLILAAGFVKGMGFTNEVEALAAVEGGKNIIPGWRAIPRLVGAVEFGSFTRYPRMGNPGVVLWRDEPTRSTQNYVGLKNPGARAAAAFLHRHLPDLPTQIGINIAVSPGITDPAQERREALESLAAFVECGVIPSWFTLNLSCPNIVDDPTGNQTEGKVHDLCGAVTDYLLRYSVPLWVKIGPNLSKAQYKALIAALDNVGARAIIATNTLPHPMPDSPSVQAGVGGGRLRPRALEACALLLAEKRQHGYSIDIIGCGGVLDGESYRDFASVGVRAVQYWSALVYRGPLAAAVILDESHS